MDVINQGIPCMPKTLLLYWMDWLQIVFDNSVCLLDKDKAPIMWWNQCLPWLSNNLFVNIHDNKTDKKSELINVTCLIIHWNVFHHLPRWSSVVLSIESNVIRSLQIWLNSMAEQWWQNMKNILIHVVYL